MKTLDRICEAIMMYEGWKPGSRSYRNCNPGNLRNSTFSHVKVDGYCQFKTFGEGWAALSHDIQCKCKGRTRTGLGPTSTIQELFKVYAPEQDSNDPKSYCAFVCKRALVSPTDTLKSVADDWEQR